MFKDEEINQLYELDKNKKMPGKKAKLTGSPDARDFIPWCLNEGSNSPEDDIEEALRR